MTGERRHPHELNDGARDPGTARTPGEHGHLRTLTHLHSPSNMRRQTRLPTSILALLLVATLAAGCGDSGPTDPDGGDGNTSVASVEIQPSTARSAAQKDTTQFTARALSESGQEITDVTIDWSTSDPSVASVNAAGVTTALAEGVATITASAGGHEATAELTVDIQAEATIGSDGGTVTSSDEAVTLDVPQGALSADTTVTITAVDEGTQGFAWAESGGRHYKLEPHGLALEEPAVGTVDYEGSAEGLSLIKFNEDTTRARVVTIRGTENGEASFELSGFSRIEPFSSSLEGQTEGWNVFNVRWSVPTLHWYLEPPEVPEDSYLTELMITQALLKWDRLTSELTFEQVDSRSEAQLVFEEHGQFNLVELALCSVGGGLEIFAFAGATCFDGSATWGKDVLGSDDRVVIGIASQEILTEDLAFSVVLHEIGHALGIAHPWKDTDEFVVMESGSGSTFFHDWDRQALWHHYAKNDTPDVTIEAPQHEATFTEGESITFEGSAEDPEDGPIASDQLVWQSSELTSELGRGSTVTRSDLPTGTHTIYLEAQDLDHLIGRDTIQITIEPSDGGGGDGGSGTSDGFEDGTLTDTWTIERNDSGASGEINQEQPRFGSYAFNATVGQRPAHFNLKHAFSGGISSTTTFTAWIRASNRGVGLTYRVASSSSDANAGFKMGPFGDIRFSTDQDPAQGEDTNVLVSGFQANTWYKLEMTLDPAARAVDFRVTDESGATWTQSDIPATFGFDQTWLNARDYNTGFEFWADAVTYAP